MPVGAPGQLTCRTIAPLQNARRRPQRAFFANADVEIGEAVALPWGERRPRAGQVHRGRGLDRRGAIHRFPYPPAGNMLASRRPTAAMNEEDAHAFVAAWADAWNRRDLNGILARYTSDVELTSPLAAHWFARDDGTVRGTA